jgi:hypothetical protein
VIRRLGLHGRSFSKRRNKHLAAAPSRALLHEDVQRDPVLIHGTPEIVLHSSNPDEHLIQCQASRGRGRVALWRDDYRYNGPPKTRQIDGSIAGAHTPDESAKLLLSCSASASSRGYARSAMCWRVPLKVFWRCLKQAPG